MFRTSSRQPVQVVAPAPPIVMSSQPIYIPAPKASSSGMNQPYTILVGSHGSSRRAPIEIVVGSSSSSRRDDHPVQPTRDRRHSTTHYHQSSSSSHGHSYEQPKIIISSSPSSSSKHHRSTSASSAPRSDVATYGGSVYGDVRSRGHSSSHDSHGGHHRDDQHYHSHGHSDSKRESATSRRNSIAVPQQSSSRHRTYSGSGDYLRPPTMTTTQPVKIPSSSPQKHTRFAALPQSVPTKPVALPPVNNHHSVPIQVASSYPVTNARPHGHHRSSHSHDLTLYATRPRHSPPLGWFNRRGDQYLVESGLVRKADGSTKWNAVFNDYPEPGTGWMDHEKRFIPASGGILKH